jgi:hypothetical protein
MLNELTNRESHPLHHSFIRYLFVDRRGGNNSRKFEFGIILSRYPW